MTPHEAIATAIAGYMHETVRGDRGAMSAKAGFIIDTIDALGFVIVPKEPTKAMISACCDALRKREEEMGDAWVPISAKAKALIRWDAMIAASQESRDD